ncbi:MAG: urease accessory protein UreD [Dongiaceae bacterium]
MDDGAPGPRLQRCDGAVDLAFRREGGRTVLDRLYQRAPSRLLFPTPHGDPEAVLALTSGGLAGGDRVAIAVEVGPGAGAVVAGQAMEKVYRTLDAPARMAVRLTVGAGARLAWLPQETILFDGAGLERRTRVDIAPGGRFLGCEAVLLGRTARGERFARGLLLDRWEVAREGRLAWADGLRLDGDVAAAVAAPSGLAGATAVGSVVYAGEDAAGLLALARWELEGAGLRAAAGLVNGLLLARLVGDGPALRAALVRLLAALRAAALGGPAALPRVWLV